MTRLSDQSAARKLTLLVLGALVIITIFLLPQFVSDPWIAEDINELPAIPDASPSTVAPSTAAELTLFRQESQGVLAEIMAMRDRLTRRQVESWAALEFQQAQRLIATGDERYSYGDYESSLEQFRQARDLLTEIENLGQQKLAEAKAEAKTAIEALNVNVASASVELANAIAPEDPVVQKLATRSERLPQVSAYIVAGDQALARDRFQEAQAEYRKAVDLDPSHERAANSLAVANREVTASVFRAHMSRGFTALESGDYEGARSAFLAAGKIRPGDDAVEKAIAQANNRESGEFVSRELNRAAELELREEWREAVSIYDALLQKNPSLTDARVKLIPARVRADLDERLVAYIDEPLRLSSKAEYMAAQTTLADAKGIPNPGPRLAGQIADLDSILETANSPVDVVFRSDNQTHVVLYRVAELGRFEQVSVKLRPGKYVAAGTRSGYRDVRVEFTVTGEALEKPIVVSCQEPIG